MTCDIKIGHILAYSVS